MYCIFICLIVDVIVCLWYLYGMFYCIFMICCLLYLYCMFDGIAHGILVVCSSVVL